MGQKGECADRAGACFVRSFWKNTVEGEHPAANTLATEEKTSLAENAPRPMVTYTYETLPRPEKPVRRYEIRQSIKDAPLKQHPETGEAIRRCIVLGPDPFVRAATIERPDPRPKTSRRQRDHDHHAHDHHHDDHHH